MGGHLERTQIADPGVALKPPSSLLGTALEHQCPRCQREVELPLGELCSDCKANIEQRARVLSRYVAIGTTLPFAVYVYLRLPDDAALRLAGVGSVAAWYVITGLVTKRIASEWLR